MARIRLRVLSVRVARPSQADASRRPVWASTPVRPEVGSSDSAATVNRRMSTTAASGLAATRPSAAANTCRTDSCRFSTDPRHARAAARSRAGSAVGQCAARGPAAGPPSTRGGGGGADAASSPAESGGNGRAAPGVEACSAFARLLPVTARPPAMPSTMRTQLRQPCHAASAAAS